MAWAAAAMTAGLPGVVGTLAIAAAARVRGVRPVDGVTKDGSRIFLVRRATAVLGSGVPETSRAGLLLSLAWGFPFARIFAGRFGMLGAKGNSRRFGGTSHAGDISGCSTASARGTFRKRYVHVKGFGDNSLDGRLWSEGIIVASVGWIGVKFLFMSVKVRGDGGFELGLEKAIGTGGEC